MLAGGDRILGLDPGLNIAGYGVLEATPRGPSVIEAGVIRAVPASAKTDLGQRLRSLFTGLTEVIEQYRPKVMVVEQLYAHYDHPRTAILMAHARGALILAAGQQNLPVLSYAATRVKKTITGSGRAPKLQVQLAVQRELGLAKIPDPPDVADALAIALCHYHALRKPAALRRSE